MASTTPQQEFVYAAMSAETLVGMSPNLDSLLARLWEEWERTGEDVAVWQSAEEGPRHLVVVLRAGPLGNPSLTWFRKQASPRQQPPPQEENEQW